MNSRLTQADLSAWEDNWTTEMGAWFPGERVVFRGQDLFADLLIEPGQLSWMGLMLYGICGRKFDEQQLKLFEGIWSISTSFPDPRLWNNRIAALAVSARSTSNLGLSAGLAASEAIIYGHRPLVASMHFLCDTRQRLIKDESLEQVLEQRLTRSVPGKPGAGKNRQVAKIPGFGRPITAQDERIQPLLALAEHLGFDKGGHVVLAREIELALQCLGHNLRMNIATLMGALCADQGLNVRQYYHYITLCFSAGIMCCAYDAEQKPQGTFFPLPCERIDYSGPAQRQWE